MVDKKYKQEFYETILNTVREGLWVSDSDDRIIFFNRGIEVIAGVSAEKMIGLSVTKDFPEETTGQFLVDYYKAKESLKPVSYESEVVTPDGRFTIQAGTLTPIVVNSIFDGMICTTQDVTESRQTERALVQEAAHTRRILEIAPVIIITLDYAGNITLLNKAGARVLECDPEDAIGLNWFETFLPQENKDVVKQVFAKIQSGELENVEHFENEILTLRSKSLRCISWYNNLLKDEDGVAIGLISSGRDITESKQAEERLFDSEKRSRAWLANSPVCTKILDLDFNLQYMSNAGVEQLKLEDITQYYGQPYPLDFYPEKFCKDMTEKLEKAKATGETLIYEGSVLDVEENELWFHSTIVPVKDEEGRVEYIMVISMEITDRKQAEASLRASKLRQSAMIENISDVIAVIDKDGINRYKSENIERMFGWRPEELVGVSTWDNIHPDDLAEAKVTFSSIFEKSHSSVTGECRYKCKDGSYKWIEYTAINLLSDPVIEGILLNYRDITERKQREEIIKQQKYYLEKAQELGQIGSWKLDLVEDKLFWTDESCRIFGSPVGAIVNYELFMEKVHPDDRDYVKREWIAAVGGKPYDIEHRVLLDGSIKWLREKADIMFDEDGAAISAIGFAQDITEQKNVEEKTFALEMQLRQSQKLEAIGTLASGVAHEINNPIMGIMNYAQLIMDKLNPEDEISEFAQEISRETDRVATIVKNLLSFARHEKHGSSPARICDIVNNTLSLIKTTIRHSQINLKVKIPEDFPEINCRSQQIQQVVMNLLTNALDALNEKYPKSHKNKKISVTAKLRKAAEKQWIRVTFEDCGNGITEEVRERMFEPFFTTKPHDKGTGLGLSISHGIVGDHGGVLSVESKVGKWTRFHMDLPVTKSGVVL